MHYDLNRLTLFEEDDGETKNIIKQIFEMTIQNIFKLLRNYTIPSTDWQNWHILR